MPDNVINVPSTAAAVEAMQGGVAMDEGEFLALQSQAQGQPTAPEAGEAKQPAPTPPPAPGEKKDVTVQELVAKAVEEQVAKLEAEYANRFTALQSAKEREIAEARERAQRLEQERRAAEARAAELEAWRQQQEENYWRSVQEFMNNPNVPPEEKRRFNDELQQWQMNQMAYQLQQAELRRMMTEAALRAVDRGIPYEALDMSSPEALKFSVQRYLDLLDERQTIEPAKKTIAAMLNKLVQKGKITQAQAQAVASGQMTVQQLASQVAAKPTGAQGAQAQAQAQGQMVTPGSTSGEAPMNIMAQFRALLENPTQENIARARDLRAQMRRLSGGVDQTID